LLQLITEERTHINILNAEIKAYHFFKKQLTLRRERLTDRETDRHRHTHTHTHTKYLSYYDA